MSRQRLPSIQRKRRDQIRSKIWFNVPDSLKKAILQLYPEVEIHYINRKYHVFRVLGNGASKGNDLLIHEFSIKKPLGWWLVEHLCQHDAYRKSGDSLKEFDKAEKAHDDKQEEKKQRADANRLEIIESEFSFIARGRESINLVGVKL